MINFRTFSLFSLFRAFSISIEENIEWYKMRILPNIFELRENKFITYKGKTLRYQNNINWEMIYFVEGLEYLNKLLNCWMGRHVACRNLFLFDQKTRFVLDWKQITIVWTFGFWEKLIWITNSNLKMELELCFMVKEWGLKSLKSKVQI